MIYTDGGMTVRIKELFDDQQSKYVEVKVYGYGKDNKPILIIELEPLHHGDIEVIKDALVEYFETST